MRSSRLLRCGVAALLCSASAGQVVVHTWPWTQCSDVAWAVLQSGGSAVDAVAAGAAAAEADPSVDSVGPGAHPDSDGASPPARPAGRHAVQQFSSSASRLGETTLDALIVDGDTMNVGAVGALRRVAPAAAVARLVLAHTGHSLLVGSQATAFAADFGGWPEQTLSSAASERDYERWRAGGCQPNYWVDTTPPANASCGPYDPAPPSAAAATPAVPTARPTDGSHDTISLLAIDAGGAIASASSTNGLSHKIAGRVGDAAVPGAGSYAVRDVGACGATGDGDVMMRFLPCYQAVESLRLGATPTQAARDALSRIAAHYPLFQGALVVLAADGRHAGAVWNWHFAYTVRDAADDAARVVDVAPMRELSRFHPRGAAPGGELRAWRQLLPGLGAAFATGACAGAAAVALRRSRNAAAPGAGYAELPGGLHE